MARERLTKVRTAGDPTLGQSANDYWRRRALDAIKGAMSDVEKSLTDQAQKVTNEEAAQLGVAPAQYAPAAPVVAPTPASPEAAPAEGMTAADEDEKKENEMESKEKQASVQVFEPRQRSAAGPVNPAAIGAQKWREMALKFPQYVKDPSLQPSGDPKSMTMLGIPATRYNQAAVSAIVNTLGAVAGKIESVDQDSALQLDLVSELLIASVEESEQTELRLAAASECKCEKCGCEKCECE